MWLGTTSMVTLMPCRCAAATNRSNAGIPPKSGSMSRGSATSYPWSAIGETVTGLIQIASTPSCCRWSSRLANPSRSPTPSPLLSANDRG
ncbi:Uncharacterised protein [Mycobacterium tuberculosis]|uniref:Uncharacterized protein n=1 Tax=Mycobacterium tuberculosis TaxID=1773 RepID=A0A0U0RP97_MYCTX|nr:Uncharacterised protein [Mycobacterium tuberculosis]